MTPLLPPAPELKPQVRVVGVAELARYLKSRLEGDPALQHVWVRGEIASAKLHPPSGHRYLTLREGDVSLKGVIWARTGARLSFEPQPGMDALALCRVTLYPRDGTAELVIDDLQPYGVGAAFVALEQLRRRLEADGLFDPARKRPLPRLPRLVGVVTSASGAAIRDIVSVIRRRAPGVSILLSPATVQGRNAPAEIVAALNQLAQQTDVQVVVVGRGGGAVEDLSAFNDEAVVRAVAAMPVPVVAAVGHQTDWTFVDHAADHRAPTPSAAAELAVPDVRQLAIDLMTRRTRLAAALHARLGRERQRLAALSTRPVLTRPELFMAPLRRDVDSLRERLDQASDRVVHMRRDRLAALAGRLEALSPLAVLARGYAVVRELGGRPVRSVTEVSAGARISVALRDGRLIAQVEEVEPDHAV